MKEQFQQVSNSTTQNQIKKLSPILWAGMLVMPLDAVADDGAGSKCHAVIAHEMGAVQDWYGGISSSIVTEGDLGSNLNIQLFRDTVDEAGPRLISNISKDESTGFVTLEIDPLCGWSNGRPITSQDMKLGFELSFSPAASDAITREGIFKNGEAVLNRELPVDQLGIEILDDHTLRFESELGVETLRSLLASNYFVPLPSWEPQKTWDAEFFATIPEVYSGPYMVTDYDESGHIELALNPHFCGAKPFFETAEIFPALTAKEFVDIAGQRDDLAEYVTTSGYSLVREIMAIDGFEERFRSFQHSESIIAFTRLNAIQGPLQEQDLRRAFQLAIDWFGERGVEARLTQIEGRAPANSLLPENFLEGVPNYPKDSRPREERLEEARALLAEHGFTDDNPLVLRAAFTSDQTDFFYLTKEMVEEGLPIEIEEDLIEDIGEYYRTVHLSDSTDYDISLARWGSTVRWPMFYIEFYYYNNIIPEALTEAGQPYMDTILKSSDSDAVDQAGRDAVQQLIDADIYIPYFADGGVDILANNVRRIEDITGTSIWNLAYDDETLCEN